MKPVPRLIAAAIGAALLVAAPAPGARAQSPAPTLQSIPLDFLTGSAPARETRPFALAGLTWNDPAAALGTTVEIRARAAATGDWSAWQELEADGRSPAEAGSADDAGRGRTDPLWFGMSDAVQVRGSGGATPAGLRLDLINPDVDVPAAGSSTTPEARAAAALPSRPIPNLLTRAQWGANEAIVKEAPQYTPGVKVVFVHHTATSNNYSCADSASIVRGIEAYHVRSNGWNDIGYNFLVDKCGRLFEGRRGGVTRAVLGAHTLGFNTYSSAIAVIGNYDARSAPSRVRQVIAQVAAYKLGGYGISPLGKSVMISSGSDRYPRGTRVALNRISGHRDTGRTTCPGGALYGQLASIRQVAGAAPVGLRVAKMAGATAYGPTYYTRGVVRPYWALSTPSSMMNRFDVYVDGRLYTSGRNTTRAAVLRLAAGRHSVGVVAVHLSGRTSRIVRTVMVDVTPPKFVMGPALVLRPGSLNGSVPVRIGWGLGDPSGVRFQGLSSPRPVVLGTAVRTYNTIAAPGRATLWAVKATDRAGNTAVGTVRRTPTVLSDAAGTRTGRWVTLRNPRYL
ncbi:N-acetylmuramoyl-L-alanine amidase, partial [Actinoplanes sp. NPDC051633]|uniref:peptidoglycan recognition protein family protein n=1 Tax=Actinoplanes sp. NPDC051633 TaxID=3155670 RepID=UPI0034370FA3